MRSRCRWLSALLRRVSVRPLESGTKPSEIATDILLMIPLGHAVLDQLSIPSMRFVAKFFTQKAWIETYRTPLPPILRSELS